MARKRGKSKGKIGKEIKKIEKHERMALPAAVDTVVMSKPARMGIPGRNGGKRGKKKKGGRGRGLRQSAGSERVTLSGREYLQAVNITSSQQIGDTLFSGIVSPQSLSATRLQIFAGLYERWRLRKWKVSYIPETGTGTAGNLVLYYEPDPTDFIPSGQIAISKALASKGIDFPVYSMLRPSVSAKVEKEFTNLYTTDSVEVRMSQAGLIVCFCNFVSTFTGTTTVGQLVLDYEVEFFKPLLELNSGMFNYAAATVVAVSPSAGALFGTSSFLQEPLNTLDVVWLSNTQFQFQPRTAGDVYTMVIRGIGFSGVPANPTLGFVAVSGLAVGVNYSVWAGVTGTTVGVYNITCPDSSLIKVTQSVTMTNSPTSVIITMTKANSVLQSRKKSTFVEKRIDKLEALLNQILEQGNSFELVSDGKVEPVPVEELIKKYLSDKR